MESTTKDDTDLTFKATFSLNTLAEEETLAQQTVHTYERNRYCTSAPWLAHKTLLVRVAVFIFFALLVTLLETAFPDKTGFLTQLFRILTHGNDTIGIGGK